MDEKISLTKAEWLTATDDMLIRLARSKEPYPVELLLEIKEHYLKVVRGEYTPPKEPEYDAPYGIAKGLSIFETVPGLAPPFKNTWVVEEGATTGWWSDVPRPGDDNTKDGDDNEVD